LEHRLGITPLQGFVVFNSYFTGRCPVLMCFALSGLVNSFVLATGRCPVLIYVALSGLCLLLIQTFRVCQNTFLKHPDFVFIS
jgi:hypothetical protein